MNIFMSRLEMEVYGLNLLTSVASDSFVLFQTCAQQTFSVGVVLFVCLNRALHLYYGTGACSK
jgi:hypothetical protein